MKWEELSKMKKTLSFVLALMLTVGILCPLVSASADIENWYVKTANGKGLNVRDLTTGEKIGVVPYGGTVGVEFFNKDGWAIIIWGSVGEAKVRQEYLVKKNPGKYVGPTDGQGNVLTDTVLGSQTVEGLNKQYAALRYVDSYSVIVVPDTRTGTARFRWAPSKNSTLIAQLPANYELTVLAASSNWIMAQDPTSGKIGYIAAKYTAAK
jgi:hypothetical protein